MFLSALIYLKGTIFLFINLLETLGFPDIHAHYIFLKWVEENRTNNYKKGLILLFNKNALLFYLNSLNIR